MKWRFLIVTKIILFGILTTTLMVTGVSAEEGGTAAADSEELVGLFKIAEGECATAEVDGSYFRMIQPGGNPDTGPFVTNSDSPCTDDAYTPFSPGDDGGLSTSGFQPNPDPAFDTGGHGRARRIVLPVRFFGVDFAVSTNKSDPQSGTGVPTPMIVHDGNGALSGDVSAFSAAWNNQNFNQGSPKPGGQTPGLTAGPTGTFVSDTGEFVLEWNSTIEGGPFDGFTGMWHLEGALLVSPDLTFAIDDTSVTKNQKVSMSGVVAPAGASETVTIITQRRRSGTWDRYDKKTTTSDASGSFDYEHRAFPKGRYRARATVSNTTDHASGKSAWQAFKVGGSSGALARAASSAAAAENLYGVFHIEKGICDSGGFTGGSFFQMTQPGGDPDSGPYVENGDSSCDDKRVTPVSPGTDGGFSTSEYQPTPDPAFDSQGNGTANRIAQPQKWFGVTFAVSTNATDPQTGDSVAVPKIVHDGNGNLSGDTRAYSAAWNGEHFNQGSPKPSGSKPGNTSGPTGTYDPGTGRFVLEWRSQIQGGPFNNFTGTWHLEGTFEPGPAPKGGGASAGGDGADGTSSGSDAATTAGGNLPNTGSPFEGRLGVTLLALGCAGLGLDLVLRGRPQVVRSTRRRKL